MAGKTISTYTSEDTARRVDHLSRTEDRKPSQIASAALDLYVQISPEAHAALRYVQAMGSPDDVEHMIHQIERVLFDARFEMAERRVVASMTVQGLDALETEDDILAEAVRLTAQERLRRGSSSADAKAPEANDSRVPKRSRSV